MNKILRISLAVFWSVFLFSLVCPAQEKFPTKPVYVIVAQGAGGSTDIPWFVWSWG